jgi:ketosteroid isomerase-like protein
MSLLRPLLPCLFVALASCAAAPPVPRAVLAQQVADTERAFAKTMADRDHAAFAGFLADDTVFFTGSEPLRGKAAVAAHWKRFYAGDKPPFSWRPDRVEVLDSGDLALSTGPVLDPDGKPVASFTSVWRQVAPGVWRIVFDKGCNCP